MIHCLKRITIYLALSILVLTGWTSSGLAETTAQSSHWGALAFPDHDRTVALGFTTDRFNEFDETGNRYNDIRQTSGFNVWSLSWTERLEYFKGWNANLTVGAGPTGDRFSRYLQNDVVHKFRDLTPIPVGATREAIDFMASGTLMKWMGLLGSDDVFFYGVGGAAGSLYYEPYVQMGFRRLSLLEFVPVVSDCIRFSALARAGRPFSGAAFHQVANHSYLGQASVGIGNYRRKGSDTPWEIEVGLTVDSGLFVDHRGDSLEERFVTAAFRYSALTFETWNDLINQKDSGPSFGARLTLDVLYLYDRAHRLVDLYQ
jgi:hypothetical protein